MKILVFGDLPGVPLLLRHLPTDALVGIVAASIRPQYVADLQALASSLNVQFLLQPVSGCPEYTAFVDHIRALEPDLLWVNSYSMIIREDVLGIARLGGINIHGALLPRNRGCSPIQWSILKGEHETGVTLHEIDSGIDTGPIIDQLRFPIFFEDSWLDVRQRLVHATDALISKNISKITSENWSSVSQVNMNATVGKRRTAEDGFFLWTQPLVEIYNKVRALLPPLPPAFYQDNAGKTCFLKSYHSIWQLALIKYGLSAEWGGLQTKNVRLRPLRKSDADLLYEWITDRDLVINNSPFFPVPENDNEAWVERIMTKRSDLVVFVIDHIASEQAIGTCQLVNINWLHRSAELQIRIGEPTLHGRGYGSEAVSILCRFGFNDLNLHRIYLHVLTTNQRAIRAYEKCGFESQGTLKKAAYMDGRWVDVQLMSQLEPQTDD